VRQALDLETPGRRDYFCPRLFEVAPYDDRMICEFFCLNADFAAKAQVNMVSLDLSMAAAQPPHTKGSIGLAYSLLPARKRVNSKSRTIAASTLVRETMTAQIWCSIVVSFALQ
jgi:hypothetical protein